MTRLAIILVLLATPLQAVVLVDCTLSERAHVADGFVSLAQVSTLAGDAGLTALAAKVLLGKAPAADDSREIALDFIKRRLKQSGLNPDEFAFYGADSVLVLANASGIVTPPARSDIQPTVPRPAAPIQNPDPKVEDVAAEPPRRSLAGAALDRIANRLKRRFPGREAELRVKEIARGRGFDDGARLVDVRPRQAAETLGKLDYEVIADGERTTISVEATLEITRVVAARDLPRGAGLSGHDLTTITLRTTDISAPGFAALADAVGREPKKPIRKGEVIADANSTPGLLVRKGDHVRLKAVLPGGGSIVTTGTAMEHGARDALIRVRRGDGRREVEVVARVAAAGECVAE